MASSSHGSHGWLAGWPVGSFTMTNMPIKRFADFLHRRGELVEYMDLLVRNFNADTIPVRAARRQLIVNPACTRPPARPLVEGVSRS
jgi:hypothetical protein